MLQPTTASNVKSTRARVAIVASEYNRRQVDGLVDGAVTVLRAAGVEPEIVRVPGAFEIPVVVECLLRQRPRRWDVVIALGVVIRGATAHADLIGGAITQALMDIAVRHTVPVIHEVLLVTSEAQAEERCFNPRYNRGGEAAQTALSMAATVRGLGRARRPGRGGKSGK